MQATPSASHRALLIQGSLLIFNKIFEKITKFHYFIIFRKFFSKCI